MRVLCAAVVVVGASVLATAQQFVLSPTDRANLLAITFTAVGPDGQPVRTLTTADVSIRLAGRTRPAVSVEYVRAPTEGEHQRFEGLAPFGDNRDRVNPRSIVLMVEESTLLPGRAVDVTAAIRHLASRLSPSDRVALVTLPFGRLVLDLTADRGRLLQTIGGLRAFGPRTESVDDARCRTVSTLDGINQTLTRLSAVEDPVTVVFFSSHLSAADSVIRAPGSAPVSNACELRQEAFAQVGVSAARARATVFIVHADQDQRARGLQGLEDLAGVTGAPLIHLSNQTGTTAMDRVVSDTAGYYVARVARDAGDVVARDEGVTVSTSRPGVTIWHAPRFVITPLPAARSIDAPDLSALLGRADIRRDLPLRLTGHSFRSPIPDRVRLAITLDTGADTRPLAAAFVAVFDAAGRMVEGLDLGASVTAASPVVAAMDIPAGRYMLRAAARDAAGLVGSVEQVIDVSLSSTGVWQTSDVMVGLSRSGAFVPILAFRDEPTMFAMLELYGPADAPSVSVTFEVAPSLRGPATHTVKGLVETTTDPTRRVATTVLPIGGLAPGDYVVRATVAVPGSPSIQRARVIRKLAQAGTD